MVDRPVAGGPTAGCLRLTAYGLAAYWLTDTLTAYWLTGYGLTA